MRNLSALLLFGCLIGLNCCQSAQNSEGEFKLLPLPQHFEIKGSSALFGRGYHSLFQSWMAVNSRWWESCSKILKLTEKESAAQVLFKIDSIIVAVKAEGYTLEIEQKRITIIGKDRAGLLYGFKTLEQLMIDASDQGVKLPLCNIEDYPELAYRAIHLDVKHHWRSWIIIIELMDQLAHYKINAIIAEVEDKLGYELQPLVASEDALSIEEWKKLSDYALERNIEISPLVQGLGHASFILKHEEYADLRDDPEVTGHLIH